MWASPDCTSHSKAKGGKPRERGLRILPWAVYKHAKAILPDVIIMENVEEIQQWGPLDENGYPIPERRGEDYQRFIASMKSIGYIFSSRELVAADYGAPTTRKRWYAIFRRDGREIVWPEPTHSKGGTGGLKPWEPIYKYLDLQDIGKSIFGRKKPLAEKTMKRIAKGLEKFVFNCPEPFIINYKFQNSPRGSSDPLSTITTVNNHYLATPLAAPFIDKSYGGNYKGSGSAANAPIHTITVTDHNRIISPFLIQYHSETAAGEVRGQQVTEPIMTIDTSNRYGLVAQYMTKFYGKATGSSVREPIHTITTSAGHFGIVSVLAIPKDDLGQRLDINDKIAAGELVQKCTWVSQFLMEYYGCGVGQSVFDPLHTIVTKDRLALVTVLGGEYAIVDIFLRMLKPEELKLGQGFPRDYIIDRDIDWRPYPAKEQVARIGNSVVPIMAETLVAANCPYLKVGPRVPNLRIYDDELQLRFA